MNEALHDYIEHLDDLWALAQQEQAEAFMREEHAKNRKSLRMWRYLLVFFLGEIAVLWYVLPKIAFARFIHFIWRLL